ERISAFSAHEEEHIEEGLTIEKVNQPIYVKNVDFSYGEEPILSGINFTIEPGKVTAIVGPSGGGKTTTFSLLERYYQPTSGSITLGDILIETFSLQSWRSQIGYVAQE
uniref:ATP-binding cassette domain-containing protein n=1 Tax=Lysinibacillus fusiformis TaxID=28031 RepID=UPI00201C7726